jgi:hypothetical protein
LSISPSLTVGLVHPCGNGTACKSPRVSKGDMRNLEQSQSALAT